MIEVQSGDLDEIECDACGGSGLGEMNEDCQDCDGEGTVCGICMEPHSDCQCDDLDWDDDDDWDEVSDDDWDDDPDDSDEEDEQ